MSTPTIAEYLKFANLQMAAEAFLVDINENGNATVKNDIPKALTEGNLHATRFTAAEATKFAAEWQVVAQCPNTSIGFSGTLFRNKDTNEYVISFRSTEFVDDAIRDSAATNTLEIFNTGWAWGQLSHMEAWYQSIKSQIDRPLNVTGYSLGGHLATAFNLLHPGAAQQVVTFNGAGVGELNEGQTLQGVLDYFNNLRANPEALKAALNLSVGLAPLYEQIRTNLANGTWTGEQARHVLNTEYAVPGTDVDLNPPPLPADAARIRNALEDIIALQKEADRIKSFTSGGTTDTPLKVVPAGEILAQTLDYRLAVDLASQRTSSKLSVFSKTPGEPPLTNQWDMVGKETTSPPWSAVANSGVHYGTNVDLFIEGQPLTRGTFVSDVLRGLTGFEFNLLQDKYDLNNFADSHSLVLIVDSLAVQNALANLLLHPARADSKLLTTLTDIFKAASWHLNEDGKNNSQGKAEGDVLENVVNALADLFLGPAPRLNGSLDGNTWAEPKDVGDYTGRETFYKRLQEIVSNGAYTALKGKLKLRPSSGVAASNARDDFASFAALYSLSPFVFQLADGVDAAAFDQAMSCVDNALYTLWQADRSAVAAGGGAIEFSDQWLKDRALFLTDKNHLNKMNRDPSLGYGWAHYKDVESGYEILPTAAPETPDAATQKMYFGGKGTDILTGDVLEDHLYGGGGDDTLRGLGGNDWLEGNAGDDLLDGGDNNDTLIGGSGEDNLDGGNGDDTLRGGTDDDILRGGAGFDTYRYRAGDGHDTIIETREGDHVSGRIVIERDGGIEALSGLVMKQGDQNVWVSADGKITLSHNSPWTLSFADGGTIQLGENQDDFQSGDFGLRLYEEKPAPTSYEQTLVGDLQPFDFDATEDGIQTREDEFGNLILDPDQSAPDRSDSFGGSADDDQILGLGGNDLIYLNYGGGADYADGGSGMDMIWGGTVGDILIGGSDSDILHGGEDDDRIYGETQITLAAALASENPASGLHGDLGNGLGGDDLMIFDTGNDYVAGGNGDDVIAGGAGDDNLYGDLELAGAAPGWSATRQVTSDGSTTGYTLETYRIGRDFTSDPSREAGNDVIYGGGGSDWGFGEGGDDYLDGGDGNDALFGQEGNDELFGGAGDDVLSGDDSSAPLDTQGNDYLDGEDGDDVLYGSGGDDDLFGGAGNDRLNGHIGDDYLDGEDGDDKLNGMADNDSLFGGAGKDQLFGGEGDDYLDGEADDDLLSGESGNDYLEGGAGDDELYGGEGNDTLVGGQGTDVLDGGDGDDTYLLEAGDGPLNADGKVESITDRAGTDTVEFGAGITLDSIRFAASSNPNYVVVGYGSDDKVAIEVGSIESFAFADGQRLSFTDLVGRASPTPVTGATGTGEYFSLGGYGNDTIMSPFGNAAISGGRGDDTIVATGGNNTYYYATGDGTDRITDSGRKTAADGTPTPNRLKFGAAIAPENLRLSVAGSALVIRVGDDPNDVIYVEGFNPYWPLSTPAIDLFEFEDGKVLTYAQLLERGFDIEGTGGGDTLGGTALVDRISGQAGNDTINGGDGADRISGGAGNDTVSGGAGADTYYFARGDGQDTIQDWDLDNQIQFGPGIALADLVFARRADGALNISIANTSDSITVGNWYRSSGVLRSVEQLVLADSTSFDTSALDGLAISPIKGTSSNDFLLGTYKADTIEGRAGDDVLDGGLGNDVLIGGSGHDSYVLQWEVITNLEYLSKDTVIEAAGEQSTIVLQRGMYLDLFRGERFNQDLWFHVRGAGEGFVIKDYFDGGQDWKIRSHDGSVTDMADFLALPDATGGDPLAQAWGDAIAAAEFNWRWAHESTGYAERYQLLPDGSYYSTHGYASLEFSVSASNSYSTTYRLTSDGTSYDPAVTGPTFGTTLSAYGSGSASYSELFDHFGVESFFSNPNRSMGQEGGSSSGSSAPAVLQVQWGQPGGSATSSYLGQTVGQMYLKDENGNVITDENGQATVVEWTETRHYVNRYSGWLGGSVQGVVTGTAGVAPSEVAMSLATDALNDMRAGQAVNVVPLSSQVQGTHSVYNSTYFVDEYHGGPQDDLVYFNLAFPVDGGDGNDFIIPGNYGNPGVVFGGNGDDTVFGSWAADAINGGNGNDYLVGNGGDDDYLVVRGQAGHDVIDESVLSYSVSMPGSAWRYGYGNGGDYQSTDTVRFGPGIAVQDLRFSYGFLNSRMVDSTATAHLYETLNISWAPGESVHVVLPDLSNPDTVRTMGYSPGSSYGIEQFRFDDGTVLTMDQIRALMTDPAYQATPDLGMPGLLGPVDRIGTEGDEFLSAPFSTQENVICALGGNDSLRGSSQRDYFDGGDGNDDLQGGAGSDVLVGGKGDDYLSGGEGADTYLFSSGDGHDWVFDGQTGEVDTIRFAPGITPADLIVVQALGSNLRLLYGQGSGEVGFSAFGVQVDFADGTRWSTQDLVSRATLAVATEQNDEIVAMPQAVVIDGLGGNDYIVGNVGDDVLSGSGGQDAIDGGAGDDILRGGGDADSLYDGSGANLLDGGAGDDELFAEAHANFLIGGRGDDWIDTYGVDDIVAFNAGDGFDTVYAFSAFTLSLGSGVAPSDLSLSRNGNDLVLGVGNNNQITLTRQWEADPEAWPAIRLQVIGETVRWFDFNAVMQEFDVLQAQDPELATWDIGAALAAHQQGESTDQAYGGLLAYRYATQGNVDDLSAEDIRATLTGAGFGRAPQPVALPGAAEEAPQLIVGTPGDDTLASGAGDDVLEGGLGDDTYLFTPGDGVDHIVDTGGTDTIAFGPGIDPDMITLGLGSLLIRLGIEGDAIHIEGFDPNAPLATSAIEKFSFADGTELSLEGLLARGFDLAGDGQLTGTALTDRIAGGEGNDTLTGGGGSDLLSGMGGDDRYVFNVGDGNDRIFDSQGSDTLFISGGLKAANLEAERIGDDLSIHLLGTDDFVTLDNWYEQLEGVGQIEFDDGSTLDRDGMDGLRNRPPVANPDLVSAYEDGGAVSVSAALLLANDTDPNLGDVLSLVSVESSALGATVSLSDGLVTYDIGSAFQQLADGETVKDEFHYTIADRQGVTASGLVEVNLVGVNDAPVVSLDTAATFEDSDSPATGNVLANDYDIDAATVLAVEAPGTYSGDYGTLAMAADGSYVYQLDNAAPHVQALGRTAQRVDHFDYVATDGMAATAAALDVFVSGINDAPIVVSPLSDRQVNFNKPFYWKLPVGSFSDVDGGDALDYTVALADGSSLPDWLQFDAKALAFSGMAPNAEMDLAVRITATDRVAATGSTEGSFSVSDVFVLSVSHGNWGVGNGEDVPPPGMPWSGMTVASNARDTTPNATAAPESTGDGKAGGNTESTASGPAQSAPFDGTTNLSRWLSALDPLPVARSSRGTLSKSIATNSTMSLWSQVDTSLATHLANADAVGVGAQVMPLTPDASPSLATASDPLATLSANTMFERFKGLKEGFKKVA